MFFSFFFSFLVCVFRHPNEHFSSFFYQSKRLSLMRWKYGWNEKSVQTFFIPFFLTYVLTSNTYTHEDHRYYINFTFPLYRFSICVCVCSIPRPFRPLQKKILLKLQSFIHFYYTEGEKNWEIISYYGKYFNEMFIVCELFCFRESNRFFVKVFFPDFLTHPIEGKERNCVFILRTF